jgi:gliding motility-associated-like protein
LLITPNNLGDDYDWQLFDITGHTPAEVYTNSALFVVGNWSGSYGLTGASSAGKAVVECASDPNTQSVPTFSLMPTLVQGHIYLLLVSHFTDSQSGYKLSFGGGTASITDPTLPKLKGAKPSCDASTVTVLLNKKMKCSSVAANGSDFSVSPAAATVVSASGMGCSSGFNMDSVTLTLSNPLPPGNYTLNIKTGTDGNTLLDNCDRGIPAGDNLPVTIAPIQPTPLDSITPVACAPKTLQFVFSKNIRCASIAPDGSDFRVTGPATVTVAGASANCNNGQGNIITITLAAPIVTGGNYRVTLVRGTDGNTLVDECGQETMINSTINFAARDTVSARFTYQLFLGCKADSIAFTHDGRNGVNKWNWTFDAAGGSNLQNPSFVFTRFGQKQIRLSVSNGVCSDTASAGIALDNELKAAFETNNLLCPEDAAGFLNKSVGDIISYEWNFGNGQQSQLKDPPPQNYPRLGVEKNYPVSLIVKNNAGCADTGVNSIKVLKTCYIAVPNAFTPNGDGMNDYLYPLNAYKADNLEFRVFNRFGQLVFQTTDWTRKWDGTINGEKQATGTYVWTLRYTDHDSGRKIFRKGTTLLLR